MTLCGHCQRELTADEMAATENPPLGTHAREDLCDRCWAEYCRSLSGPEGAMGEPGRGPLNATEAEKLMEAFVEWLRPPQIVGRFALSVRDRRTARRISRCTGQRFTVLRSDGRWLYRFRHVTRRVPFRTVVRIAGGHDAR